MGKGMPEIMATQFLAVDQISQILRACPVSIGCSHCKWILKSPATDSLRRDCIRSVRRRVR